MPRDGAQQLCPWGLPKDLPGRGEGSSSSSCGSCQPCLCQVTISMSPLVPGDEWGQTRSVPTIAACVWLRFKKGSQDWGHCRESHAWLGMVGHAWFESRGSCHPKTATTDVSQELSQNTSQKLDKVFYLSYIQGLFFPPFLLLGA